MKYVIICKKSVAVISSAVYIITLYNVQFSKSLNKTFFPPEIPATL